MENNPDCWNDSECCCPACVTQLRARVAELTKQRDDLLAALERAIKRQGFSNEELISARDAIARVKGQL
jgi:alkylhydroperoxidase family enzyme